MKYRENFYENRPVPTWCRVSVSGVKFDDSPFTGHHVPLCDVRSDEPDYSNDVVAPWGRNRINFECKEHSVMAC